MSNFFWGGDAALVSMPFVVAMCFAWSSLSSGLAFLGNLACRAAGATPPWSSWRSPWPWLDNNFGHLGGVLGLGLITTFVSLHRGCRQLVEKVVKPVLCVDTFIVEKIAIRA